MSRIGETNPIIITLHPISKSGPCFRYGPKADRFHDYGGETSIQAPV